MLNEGACKKGILFTYIDIASKNTHLVDLNSPHRAHKKGFTIVAHDERGKSLYQCDSCEVSNTLSPLTHFRLILFCYVHHLYRLSNCLV